MKRLAFIASFCFAVLGLPGETRAFRDPAIVDLRDAGALEWLERTNPAHYAKIQHIVRAVIDNPSRAERGWVQTASGAHAVQLHRNLLKTTYPPRQHLEFTLDTMRYVMYLTRHDLDARAVKLGLHD